MIQTTNLSKRYGQLMALSNLNLRIDQGDCFGFIGPNGAGKTTTIRILATLLRPTWGEARIDGLSVGPVNARAVRSIIGYVPDAFGSYDDLLVQEYLEFFAAAYDIHGAKRRQVVGDVLELTDLTQKADADVNALSRGMQQRLSVARVLLHDPKVLLLDEPASGLDPRARVEMRELLKELHRMGKTILISSHILMELAELCNKVGVIEKGELKFVGSTDEMLKRAGGRSILHVAVADRVEQAAALIRELPGVSAAELEQGEIHVALDPRQCGPAAVARQLVSQGYELTRLDQPRASLEAAFMELTRGAVQ